jgi:hypothetical protein
MDVLITVIVGMAISLAITIKVARSEKCRQFLDRVKNFRREGGDYV